MTDLLDFLRQHTTPTTADSNTITSDAWLQARHLLTAGIDRLHVVKVEGSHWIVTDEQLATIEQQLERKCSILQTVSKPRFGLHVSNRTFFPGDSILPASTTGCHPMLTALVSVNGWDSEAAKTVIAEQFPWVYFWDCASPTSFFQCRWFADYQLQLSSADQRPTCYMVRANGDVELDPFHGTDAWRTRQSLTVLATVWQGATPDVIEDRRRYAEGLGLNEATVQHLAKLGIG